MDIVQILIAQYQSQMSEQMFDLNSTLMSPTEKGALDRLDTAVKKYSILKNQIDILEDLQGQMKARENYQKQQQQQNAQE